MAWDERICTGRAGAKCNLGNDNAVRSTWPECDTCTAFSGCSGCVNNCNNGNAWKRCWRTTLSQAKAICENHSECTGITRDNGGYEPRTGPINEATAHVAAHSLYIKNIFKQVAAPGTCLKTVVDDIGMVLGNLPHTIQVRLTFPRTYPSTRQWILNLGQENTGSHHWLWNSQNAIQFGKWSACSETCGDGTQTKSYSITVDAENGGNECPHAQGDTVIQTCNLVACPVPCSEGQVYDTGCGSHVDNLWNNDNDPDKCQQAFGSCSSALGAGLWVEDHLDMDCGSGWLANKER